MDGQAERTNDSQTRTWWAVEWSNAACPEWVSITAEHHRSVEAAMQALKAFRERYDIGRARVVEVVERKTNVAILEPRSAIVNHLVWRHL
jgi:hypothetical protein